MLDCGPNATCQQLCAKGITVEAATQLAAYQTCTVSRCASQCAPAGAGGSGGTGGANGSGGTSGGTTPVGTSGSGGTTPTNPAGDWLTLVGAAAPSDVSPNGALGIEGVFYAYGDACTTPSMQWDPATRCLSGELCLADETGQNWGVAIGFDLDNRAEVKYAWNASTAGVKGFTWVVTGSPRGLQFWVQNMDPSFNGVCSAASCSIDGPPDGTSSASATGQLTFAGMQKDFWGGTGVAYTFDPANISSLQFKVPAPIDPFYASYSFCVDALGVLR